MVTVPRHIKFPPAGVKSQLRLNQVWIDQADALEVKEGEEITLMAWGNAIIRKIHRDSSSSVVSSIEADLHLEGDFKTTKLKVRSESFLFARTCAFSLVNFKMWVRARVTC